MSEKTKLKYLKPFGPGILNGYLPKNILDNFVKISDDVISKKIQKKPIYEALAEQFALMSRKV